MVQAWLHYVEVCERKEVKPSRRLLQWITQAQKNNNLVFVYGIPGTKIEETEDEFSCLMEFLQNANMINGLKYQQQINTYEDSAQIRSMFIKMRKDMIIQLYLDK